MRPKHQNIEFLTFRDCAKIIRNRQPYFSPVSHLSSKDHFLFIWIPLPSLLNRWIFISPPLLILDTLLDKSWGRVKIRLAVWSVEF